MESSDVKVVLEIFPWRLVKYETSDGDNSICSYQIHHSAEYCKKTYLTKRWKGEYGRCRHCGKPIPDGLLALKDFTLF